MEEFNIAAAINQYGFPIIAACGLGYFVYYIWTWATQEIDPVLSEAQATLIALIDRIRMLDNDLIRLNQKLNMILEMDAKARENLQKAQELELKQVKEGAKIKNEPSK
jgi:hypothetical protein|tara:strand:+ start:2253 stop:2576 length:324 start_codon:yes stop_codon:yes gene_type:complete